MQLIFSLFAQAGNVPEVRSMWDIALQFGMAGAVLLQTYLFVRYIAGRDGRDGKLVDSVAAADSKLADKLQLLSESIARLDTHLRDGSFRRREPPAV